VPILSRVGTLTSGLVPCVCSSVWLAATRCALPTLVTVPDLYGLLMSPHGHSFGRSKMCPNIYIYIYIISMVILSILAEGVLCCFVGIHNSFGGSIVVLYFRAVSSRFLLSCFSFGPGTAVGIANRYGLDGPGIESPLGRDFPHLSRPILGSNQPPVQ